MEKEYKSSITKSYEIKKCIYFLWCSPKSYFSILYQKSKEAMWEDQVTNDV